MKIRGLTRRPGINTDSLRMHRTANLWLPSGLILLSLVITSPAVASPEHPEFTGNYVECAKGWCEFQAHQLDVMSLWQELSPYTGRYGKNAVVYAGLFDIPGTVPVFTNRKPRFLFFPGTRESDPRTIALVELARLPYNNAPIDTVNGTKYDQKVNYTPANVRIPMWTFKRELQIRFKPIDGKVGMYLVEPREELLDGLYAIDSGIPDVSGHSGLTTVPGIMNFYKLSKVQTAIPFIIGDKSRLASQQDDGFMPELESGRNRLKPLRQAEANPSSPSEPASRTNQDTDIGKEVGKAVGELFKGLFQGKSEPNP